MTNIKSLIEKYSNEVLVATQNDKVYKDECVYSYDTSESEYGVFVCLRTFICVSKEMLPVHFSKIQSHLYLNIKTWRKEIIKDDTMSDEPEKKKPSKFGIGVEGGFDLNAAQFYFEHEYSLLVYPEDQIIKINLENPSQELSVSVQNSIKSIINAESYTYKEELACQAASWDGEKRFVSKHSNTLLQLNNPVQISPDPRSWKCEKCDKTNNLWLCLTDGKILCGRRQLDGSGGNNHAAEHYDQTKYPLAVKLGTITSKGADVYSYDEDDMVEDSNLAVHLSTFGINMSKMEKTEKTMAELEIDLNQKVGEWDRIQEVGSKLVPVYGAGFTGMRNLGNSCYMNSVMQVLFTLPDFVNKYVEKRDSYLRNTPMDPSNDFNFQMAKLGHGILSGAYSRDPVELNTANSILLPPRGIKPNSFKAIVGKGHQEFSSKRQQDSHEFLIHLLSLIERNLRNDTSSSINPADAFRFQLEDRIECSQSHQVRYKHREEFCLSLPIAKEAALNKDEVKAFEARKADAAKNGLKLEPGDIVRPVIALQDCLNSFLQNELVSDFYSSATKSRVNAIKSTRLSTFPDFLLIQAKKFEHAADWSPIKLDISLQVPDVLNIKEFRGTGLKPNEKELAEESGPGAAAAENVPDIALNENVISQLMDMGFSLDGSKRAAYHTRDSNDAEAAVNWAVSHMEDSDFNDPFTIPSNKPAVTAAKKSTTFNEESIQAIESWGFTRFQAIKALEATNNNLERAADWIFSHANEIMDVGEDEQTSASATTGTTSNPKVNFRDGNSTYKLVAFISHMGTNANVGHYVAHILKDGKWIIFNDENVALSENPPRDLAYLYLYKRE